MPEAAETNEPSAVTAEEFEELVRGNMPGSLPFDFDVEELERGRTRIRLYFDESQLRPGGTIAGPVLFTLADTALYAMAMSIAGLEPLAVTTDLHLRFLRKPGPADLIGVGRLHKEEGRVLMGDVEIYSDGDERIVAHATGAFALPRKSS